MVGLTTSTFSNVRPQVDYYVALGISLEEVKKHMQKTFVKSTVVTIHRHAKGDICSNQCEQFEI